MTSESVSAVRRRLLKCGPILILNGNRSAQHTLDIVEILVEERIVGEEKGNKQENTPPSERI